MLIAHGKIYDLYQKMGLAGKVGITLSADFAKPADPESAVDQEMILYYTPVYRLYNIVSYLGRMPCLT